jgi:hypothetical protein
MVAMEGQLALSSRRRYLVGSLRNAGAGTLAALGISRNVAFADEGDEGEPPPGEMGGEPPVSRLCVRVPALRRRLGGCRLAGRRQCPWAARQFWFDTAGAQPGLQAGRAGQGI